MTNTRAYQLDDADLWAPVEAKSPLPDYLWCRMFGGPCDGDSMVIGVRKARVGADIFLDVSVGQRVHVYRMYGPWDGSVVANMRHHEVRAAS